jgi:hypothetical protein
VRVRRCLGPSRPRFERLPQSGSQRVSLEESSRGRRAKFQAKMCHKTKDCKRCARSGRPRRSTSQHAALRSFELNRRWSPLWRLNRCGDPPRRRSRRRACRRVSCKRANLPAARALGRRLSWGWRADSWPGAEERRHGCRRGSAPEIVQCEWLLSAGHELSSGRIRLKRSHGDGWFARNERRSTISVTRILPVWQTGQRIVTSAVSTCSSNSP